jgi:hypothetical protein
VNQAWRAPILTYHGLHAPGWDYHENDHVAMESDLALLGQMGYQVVPLSVLVKHVYDSPDPQLERDKLVGISFDDGTDYDFIDFSHPEYGYLKSFHRLLNEQPGLGWDGGVPVGTSFVIASPQARLELDRGCIAGRDEWRDTWWQEAVESGVFEIANHSWDHTHPKLENLVVDPLHTGKFRTIVDFEAADAEILRAEFFIREKTARGSVPLFAYPYGETNEFLVQEYFPSRSEWFSAAFSTGGGPFTASCNRWSIPRYVCGDHWNSPEGLLAILKN